MPTMNGAALRKWREGKGLSQADAATLAGKSRATINRTEQSGALPDWAVALINGEEQPVAREAATSAPPKARAPQKRAKDAEAAPDERKASPAIVEALKRKPLFAKTSAEAFAMRDELARRGKCDRSTTPMIPLNPDFVAAGKHPGRVMKCNAAIPDPLGPASLRTYGPRGVLTKSGAVYDYETAHRMPDRL